MSKLMYLPLSIGTGLLAGQLSRRAFSFVWGAVDDADPPQPEQRDVGVGKLVVALALEGALLRLVKGLLDHASRQGFARLTGSWPGEERSEP